MGWRLRYRLLSVDVTGPKNGSVVHPGKAGSGQLRSDLYRYPPPWGRLASTTPMSSRLVPVWPVMMRPPCLAKYA